MAGKPVKVAVVGDASQLKRELDRATGNVEGFSSKIKGYGKDIVGAFAVAGFFRAGIDELKEAQAAAAQTAAVLKSTGGAANVTAQDVTELAGKLSKLSGKDDELIQRSENLLLTFRNIHNELGEGNQVFDRATAAALDLSVAGFGELEQTSKLLGRALNDPRTGLTALTRAGVTFTQEQKKTIRSLVETGDVLSAQKLILEEVEAQVGGSAEAYGKTLPGQIDRAKESFNNLAGNVVGVLAPALESLATIAGGLFDVFQQLPDALQAAAVYGGLAAVGMKKFGVSLDDIAIAAYNLVGGIEKLGSTLLSGAKAVYNYVSGLSALQLGLGAAGVGAAVYFAIQAFQDWNAQQQLAEQRAQSYKDALEKANGAIDENVRATIAQEFATGKIGDTLDGTTADLEVFASGIRDSGDELDRLAEFYAAGSSGVEGFDRTLREAAEGGSALAQELVRLRDAGELSHDELQLLVVELDKQSDAFAEGSEGARIMAEVQNALGVETEGTTGAVESQVDAMKELNDQIRASVDPLFGLEKATRANQKAQQELVDAELAAMAAGGQNEELNRKLAEAQSNVTDTAIDVTTAQNTLRGAMADGNVTMEDTRHLLDQLVASGLINKETADAQALAFFGLAGSVGSVPGSVTINVVATGLGYAIEGFRQLADGIYQSANATAYFNAQTGKGIITKGAGVGTVIGPPGKATGGYLNEGWNWVGEKGPEPVLKQGPLTKVFSNAEGAGMGGGSSAQPVILMLDGKVLAKTVLSRIQSQELSIR